MSLVRALAKGRKARKRSPPNWEPTLPVQRLFAEATENHRFVAVFAANGTGKTRGLARELVRVFEGKHPKFRRPIPILACVTGWQSISARDLAKQLHELAPAGLLGQQDIDENGKSVGAVRPWYSPQRGFMGEPPRVVVLRGPMRGTVLELTTLGAGSTHSAGGTFPLVVVNEPIDEATFGELIGRGRGVSGCLWYLFTPTLGSANQKWVRDHAKKGRLHLVQVTLTPEALVLSSGRRLEPWSETAERIELWPPNERDMRCATSWEPLLGATWFSGAWTPDAIQPLVPRRQLIIFGVDHSTQAGRTRIVGSAFESSKANQLTGHTFIDVRVDSSDYDVVAAAVVDACEAFGLDMAKIDYWIGDRVAMSDLAKRDNTLLEIALVECRAKRKMPRIACLSVPFRRPKKKPGSALFRLAFLRVMMAQRRWLIDPSCEHIPTDIQKFAPPMTSEYKDGLDAFGYSAELAGILTGLWIPPDE